MLCIVQRFGISGPLSTDNSSRPESYPVLGSPSLQLTPPDSRSVRRRLCPETGVRRLCAVRHHRLAYRTVSKSVQIPMRRVQEFQSVRCPVCGTPSCNEMSMLAKKWSHMRLFSVTLLIGVENNERDKICYFSIWTSHFSFVFASP